MDALGPILLVVLVVVLIGFAAYASYLAAKRRREALAALAAELGWRFDPSRDRQHDDRYRQFEIFRVGHSRVAYNTLWGTLSLLDRECAAKMGDFSYKVTTSTGKSSSTRTYRLSYLIVDLPFASLPTLLVRREGIFDKLAGAVGFDDIDFESAEFSRQFYVKSSDKRFAYAVIHPRMMEFLLRGDPPVLDLERGSLCITDGKRRWNSSEFKAELEWVHRFFSHWPDYLVTELGTRG